MGIIAGLGRGMPGRPSPRPAGGRGGRWSPSATSRSGPGAGRRPMPWLAANGLLPGRGAPGRPTGRGAGPGVLGRADESEASEVSRVGAGVGVGVGCRRCGGGCGSLGRGRARTGPWAPPRQRAPRRQGPRRPVLRARQGRRVRRRGCGLGGRLHRRLLGRLGSGRLGGLGGQQGVAVLLLELHLDGKLDRRGRRLDELAHLLQLLEHFLALDAIGLGELMNSGLGHFSPSGRHPVRGSATVTADVQNSSRSTHRVLMSCCSSFCRSCVCATWLTAVLSSGRGVRATERLRAPPRPAGPG